MINELLSVPMEIAVAMGCGYVGYFVAHLGRRDHHKQSDLILSTAIFGLISLLVYREVYRLHSSDILAVGASLILSGVVGAIWNGFGRNHFSSLVRKAGVTYSDDLPSAWRAIPDAKGYYPQQLTVVMKNGSTLHCFELADFAECINGPCVFGADGDMLMYVTHVKHKNDTNFTEVDDVKNEDFGDNITYIPKSEIEKILYRRTPVSQKMV